MKKIMVVLLTLALLVPLALCASADAANDKIGNVKNYEGSVTLDGMKDEAYEKYGMHIATSVWEGNGIDQGTGADFWFLFTDNYSKLHIFTDVRDNTPITPSAEKQAWMEGCCHTDCCEIWIDPTNNAGTSAADIIRQEAWHYRCDISGYTSGVLWGTEVLGNAQSDPYFKCNVQMKAGGYTIEWEIYTDAYAQENKRGDGWGLQIMMKDVYDARHDGEHWQTDPTRERYFMCDYTYASLMNGAYLDAGYFDYIVLGNSVKPGTPPVDDGDEGGGAADDETILNPSRDPNKVPVASPVTADGFVIAAVALLVSAGTAIVVMKKRQ